jgi:hypothetical protein
MLFDGAPVLYASTATCAYGYMLFVAAHLRPGRPAVHSPG